MFKKIVVALLIVLSLVGLIYTQSFAQQKALKFHSVPTTDTGKSACWATNTTTGELYLSSCNTTTATTGVFTTVTAVTGSITNLNTSGTATIGNLVVTNGTTTTCTYLKNVTITSGVITAATCSI